MRSILTCRDSRAIPTQLSLPTRMEEWTSLGQHKRKPEFPVVRQQSHRNSKKTTWFPLHHKMYGCESWTIKKAERRRIDAFELWCWRRLLRVPWTARSSNQSILKAISPEYSLKGLMLKLKLQYFGHLMGRTDSLERS